MRCAKRPGGCSARVPLVEEALGQQRHRDQVSRKEMTSALAMVSDSALKNAPVTPVRNASGRKITMVAALEPVSGRMNSRAAPAMRSCTSPCAAAQPAHDVLDHHDRRRR